MKNEVFMYCTKQKMKIELRNEIISRTLIQW